jgi:hypothetical protein
VWIVFYFGEVAALVGARRRLTGACDPHVSAGPAAGSPCRWPAVVAARLSWRRCPGSADSLYTSDTGATSVARRGRLGGWSASGQRWHHHHPERTVTGTQPR